MKLFSTGQTHNYALYVHKYCEISLIGHIRCGYTNLIFIKLLLNRRHFENASLFVWLSIQSFLHAFFFSRCWLFAIKMLFLKTLEISTFQTKITRIYHSNELKGANVLFYLKSKQLLDVGFFLTV